MPWNMMTWNRQNTLLRWTATPLSGWTTPWLSHLLKKAQPRKRGEPSHPMCWRSPASCQPPRLRSHNYNSSWQRQLIRGPLIWSIWRQLWRTLRRRSGMSSTGCLWTWSLSGGGMPDNDSSSQLSMSCRCYELLFELVLHVGYVVFVFHNHNDVALILSLDLYTVSVAESLYHTGQILGMCPANERRRYKATPFLIGWAQTENQPWLHPVWYYNSYITLLGKV